MKYSYLMHEDSFVLILSFITDSIGMILELQLLAQFMLLPF